MPQEFQVLRCYKCSTFQVHQIKKTYKWVCKICAEKQSIKRNYGIGSGKECRLQVQKLNSYRGEILNSGTISENNEEYDCNSSTLEPCARLVTKSKWEEFLPNDIHIGNNSRLFPNLSTAYADSELKSADIILGCPQSNKKPKLCMQSLSEGKGNINRSVENILEESDNYLTSVPSKSEVSKMKIQHTNNIHLRNNTDHIHDRIVHPAPKLLQGSKWKQFVDVETESDSSKEAPIIDKANADFFALDDEDIDEILNGF